MTRRPVEVLAAVSVLLAAVLLITVLAGAPPAVRVPLGLAVALVLPGILGFCAVRRRLPANAPEAAVSVVSNVGLLAVLGILLNLLPAGLTPTTWSVSIFVVTLAAAAAAVLRGRRGAVVTPAPDRGRIGGRRAAWVAVPLVACLALLGIGAGLTVSSQRSQNAEQRLTELWLTTEGEARTVHVRNSEGTSVEYRVVVTAPGTTQAPSTIRLAQGEEWSRPVEAAADTRAGGTPGRVILRVLLYRGQETTVYRQVQVTGGPA